MPPKKAKASVKDPKTEPALAPAPEPAIPVPQPDPPVPDQPAIVAEAKPVMPAIVENLLAPEFFATEAQSISLIQGMISIAFSSSRYDYSQTPSVLKKVTVSRIVMSPAGAQSLAVRLFAFLDQKGFGPAPKDPKQRQ
jgi:hypothetical protein